MASSARAALLGRVEGTGTYGAGLTRLLLDHGVPVPEADRPDRKTRRQRGKSDPIDAEAAARAVLAGVATALPKRRDGIVEAIRALRSVRPGRSRRAPRRSTSSRPWWSRPRPWSARRWTGGRPPSRWRPVPGCGPTSSSSPTPSRRPRQRCARWRCASWPWSRRSRVADQRLGKLVPKAAPRTLGLLAIGIEHAGQLLVTAGDNPERLRGEAAFAHLCGAAPIPASSGRTQRHRLHRGGDRNANCALHLAVVVRMRHCPRTRAYVERRTKEGLSKPEIMRRLKRYLARKVYHAIQADFAALHAT